MLRDATSDDWPDIYPVFAETVAAGETYAYPEDLSSEQARALWMQPPPWRTIVAVEGDQVLGTAILGPNRPGRGSHVATASFMVAPAAQGHGAGRALGEHVLDLAMRHRLPRHAIQRCRGNQPRRRRTVALFGLQPPGHGPRGVRPLPPRPGRSAHHAPSAHAGLDSRPFSVAACACDLLVARPRTCSGARPGAEPRSTQVHVRPDQVGLIRRQGATSALSGEVRAVAQPPPTRLGRPGMSSVIRGEAGPVCDKFACASSITGSSESGRGEGAAHRQD